MKKLPKNKFRLAELSKRWNKSIKEILELASEGHFLIVVFAPLSFKAQFYPIYK